MMLKVSVSAVVLFRNELINHLAPYFFGSRKFLIRNLSYFAIILVYKCSWQTMTFDDLTSKTLLK